MFSVIFDMDGTLFDTQRIYIPAWDYVGGLQNVSEKGKHIAEVCGMNEAGWTAFIEQNYKQIDIKKFKADVIEYVAKNNVIQLKEGATELIAFLRKNNIKIAIASGSSRDIIMDNLKAVGAENLFDVIVGGDEVQNGKPAPDVFLKTAEKLGVLPESCFVFEDSANGIRAGYAAGMKCIGVPDVAQFDDGVKKMMFAEFKVLSDAIEILKQYIA